MLKDCEFDYLIAKLSYLFVDVQHLVFQFHPLM